MKKVYLLIVLKSLFITIPAQNSNVGIINFIHTQKRLDVASPTSTKVTFVVIGDYGFSDSNEAAVANLVKSWNTDFIITLGGNNYELGESWSLDPNVGQYYHDFIYPYSCTYGMGADSSRFFPSLGNHDWYTNNAAAYFQYFTLPGNERYYDFIKANVHFFALDSDSHEIDGINSSSVQALWLKNKLQNSTSKWNVVYLHHSPYCYDAAHGSQTQMRWPFKNWGVDVVLSSRLHIQILIPDILQ